jgi:hypothetical protein
MFPIASLLVIAVMTVLFGTPTTSAVLSINMRDS